MFPTTSRNSSRKRFAAIAAVFGNATAANAPDKSKIVYVSDFELDAVDGKRQIRKERSAAIPPSGSHRGTVWTPRENKVRLRKLGEARRFHVRDPGEVSWKGPGTRPTGCDREIRDPPDGIHATNQWNLR